MPVNIQKEFGLRKDNARTKKPLFVQAREHTDSPLTRSLAVWELPIQLALLALTALGLPAQEIRGPLGKATATSPRGIEGSLQGGSL